MVWAKFMDETQRALPHELLECLARRHGDVVDDNETLCAGKCSHTPHIPERPLQSVVSVNKNEVTGGIERASRERTPRIAWVGDKAAPEARLEELCDLVAVLEGHEVPAVRCQVLVGLEHGDRAVAAVHA